MKKLRLAVCVLCCFLGLAACRKEVIAPNPVFSADCPKTLVAEVAATLTANDFVELRRTPCFGTCPEYTVRIYADGRVTWHGGRFVEKAGEAQSHVDGGAAQNLFHHALAQDFFGLCGHYAQGVTDNPTYLTTVSVHGQTRQVSDYADGAPEWLRDFDKEIDALADTHRWRHGDPAREKFVFWRTEEEMYLPKPGVTPLMEAAVRRHGQALDDLLQQGADVNAQDASGWTVLMYAAQAGWGGDVQRLLTAKADANHRSKAGETALFAVVTGSMDAAYKIRMLKQAGAEINARDNNGNTALMACAKASCQTEAIRTLMDAGANKSLKNKNGQQAVDLLPAVENNFGQKEHDLVVALLTP